MHLLCSARLATRPRSVHKASPNISISRRPKSYKHKVSRATIYPPDSTLTRHPRQPSAKAEPTPPKHPSVKPVVIKKIRKPGATRPTDSRPLKYKVPQEPSLDPKDVPVQGPKVGIPSFPTRNSIRVADLRLHPIGSRNVKPSTLAHGLDRVLFNPGVHELQDTRTGVYNFDPSIQMITPPAHFDFSALGEYLVASRDETLAKVAEKNGLKYVTSTSNITEVLTHLHYLLSNLRPLNDELLSRRYGGTSCQFTSAQYLPEGIFLRPLPNGLYAIDKIKTPFVNRTLGATGMILEKLFTSPLEKYRQYLKNSDSPLPAHERKKPEKHHYTKFGNILVRSQLDAYDSRLQGTGIFDLKTRACIPVRMDLFERLGDVTKQYEIMQQFGPTNSYEREFWDMMRTIMLKYSLQARLGAMEGIMVAYHNLARIFGFQYLTIADMDRHLHGTTDRALGDGELCASLSLTQKVLDRVVKHFPDQPVRVFVEFRGGTRSPTLNVFADPVSEAQIEHLQAAADRDKDTWLRLFDGLPDDDDLPDSSGDLDSSAPVDDIVSQLKDLHNTAVIIQDEALRLQDTIRKTEPSSPPEDGHIPKTTHTTTTDATTSSKALRELVTDLVTWSSRLNAQVHRMTGKLSDARASHGDNDAHDEARDRIQDIKSLVDSHNNIIDTLRTQLGNAGHGDAQYDQRSLFSDDNEDTALAAADSDDGEEDESASEPVAPIRQRPPVPLPPNSLVLQLQIRNVVNNEFVTRPELPSPPPSYPLPLTNQTTVTPAPSASYPPSSSTASESDSDDAFADPSPLADWTIEYDLRQEDPKSFADRYAALRKRFGTQGMPPREDTFYRSAFMKGLVELCREGRAWRESREEVERDQEKVLFRAGEGAGDGR